MENQHKLIAGYRDLSQEEIDMVNSIKQRGNEFGEVIKQLEKIDSIDKRWLAIGRTHMQEGIMDVIRSITRPDSF